MEIKTIIGVIAGIMSIYYTVTFVVTEELYSGILAILLMQVANNMLP